MSSSLMNKYSLTLDQLSFEFIGNCSNKTTLERIIKVLRSGEEGLYPDLLKHAEIHLKKLDPNNKLLEKEVHLHKRADIAQNDWNDLLNDLKSWEKDIKTQEGIVKALSTQSLNDMPKIRSDNKMVANNSNVKTPVTTIKKSEPEKVKIKSYDDWNRFDVDEELAKIDIKDSLKDEEENQRKMKLENDYTKSEAEYERAKGNQYFKNENYPYALEHYTKSINLNPSSAAFNNRAMTYIKLKMYKAAVEDCCKVLSLEASNVKALYRRSLAYIALADDNSLKNAWRDLKVVLTLEPSNKAAQKEYNSLSVRLSYSSQTQATDQLPVLFYGPSTSTFKVMPKSNVHYMWARSHLPTSYVPCRCNCAIPQENPLCRRCGEENIRRLRLKAKNKPKSSTRSLNASDIARICEKRNTNLYVLPPPPQQKQIQPTAKLSNLINGPEKDSPVVKPPLKPQVEVNLNGVGARKPEEPILSGNEKCRDLANKAMERGDASFNANDFNTALHYYSTSIKFYPQIDSLLKRAKTLIQVKRYPEAVYDCSRVLEIDPNHIQARIRRATAYGHMPEQASLMMGIKDLQNIKNVRGKKDLNDELNELLELISKRKENYVDTTIVQQDAPSGEPTVEIDCVEDNKMETSTVVKKVKKKKSKSDKDDENGVENDVTEAVELANGCPNGDNNIESSKAVKKKKKKKKSITRNGGEGLIIEDDASNGNTENGNGEMPLDVNSSNVSLPLDDYKALIKKQNKKNKKKIKKLAMAEFKDENNYKNITDSVANIQLNDKSGCSSNENVSSAALSNSINHKKTKKNNCSAENDTKVAHSNNCSNSFDSELTNNLNNIKSVSHSKLEKYFSNMMSNTVVNNEQILTRFWTMWNEFKKCDIQYMYRCKTLLTLTPDLLRTAFKKKLECQTLTDLVDTIDFLAKTNPSSAASYLSELPKMPKFNNVKQKIDQPVIEKVNILMDSLEKRQIHLQTETKEAFS